MKRKRTYLYGKFYDDTQEFHEAIHKLFSDFLYSHRMDMKSNNDLVNVRNQTVALLDSWIRAKKFEKFGIKIPLEATPPSVLTFLKKNAQSRARKYHPCEICGEARISHYCHIIPRSDGGPSDLSNYIYLCPLHHHLFDDNRLSKKEWDCIKFSEKSDAARQYTIKIRLPRQENYWNRDLQS